MKEVDTHFADARSGGFFFTSDDHEKLLTRSKDPFDKAIPSGNGMASLVLVRLARITGSLEYLTKARRCFVAFLGIMQQAPRASESMLLALANYYDQFTPEQRGERVEPAATATPAASATADAVAVKGPVKVEAFVSRDCIAPGDSVVAAVRFTVDAGWHVNAHEPGLKHLTPTKVALKAGGALTLARIAYPSGKDFQPAADKDAFKVYENEALVAASFRLATDVKDGPVDFALEVTFQACDDQRCLAPHKVQLALPLKVSAGARKGEGRHKAIFENLDFK
jgi:DsbC/DsbD-like thiol-disulfide interchange protein